jgi:hypothetical protein
MLMSQTLDGCGGTVGEAAAGQQVHLAEVPSQTENSFKATRDSPASEAQQATAPTDSQMDLKLDRRFEVGAGACPIIRLPRKIIIRRFMSLLSDGTGVKRVRSVPHNAGFQHGVPARRTGIPGGIPGGGPNHNKRKSGTFGKSNRAKSAHSRQNNAKATGVSIRLIVRARLDSSH